MLNAVSNINFGSIKLFKVKLTKENALGEKKPLKGYISLLEKSDLRRLDLQDDNWTDSYGHKTFGNDIIWDMQQRKNTPFWDDFYFIGVECPDEPRGEKIKALAEIITCNDAVKLSLLQSKTTLDDITEKTNGAGACVIYLLTKMAQILNKNKIKLTSYNDDSTSFYKKFGFEQDVKANYIMNASTIPAIQKAIEEKYGISPVRCKNNPVA